MVIFAALLLGTLGAEAQRYDRGYESPMPNSTVFAGKGTFMVGGNAKYSQHANNNYKMLVFDNINSNGYTISASPSFCYMVKDNMGIGARFSYDRNFLMVDSGSLNVSEISMSVDDYYRLSQTFSGLFIYRMYIPLGTSARFAIFAEVQAGGATGRTKNTVQYSAESVKGSYEQRYKLMFGVNPGVTAFITNHFALEANVGMMGLSYNWADQSHNQVVSGGYDSAQASFMINILSVGIGLSYYL